MSEERSKEGLALEKYFRLLINKKGFSHARAYFRIKDGVLTDEPCVTVAVSKKLPLCQLTEEERVPATLPDGTPTDVIEMQKVYSQPKDGEIPKEY